MEVVVTFVGGDIDRPMVLGAVYDGTNPPPHLLPAHKTQSGIRTRSSPGGGGSNEIRFEDAAGAEQIYVHAQRDLREVVENDRTRVVNGQEAVEVAKNRTIEVRGDHVRTVLGNEIVTIEKNLSLHIAGKHIIHVDGSGDGSEGPAAATNDTDTAPGVASSEGRPDSGLQEVEEGGGAGAAGMTDVVARAQLLWVAEQLPDDLYAKGQELVSAIETLRGRMRTLDRASPEEARVLRGTVFSQSAACMAKALEPAPPAFRRLQVLAVEQIQGLTSSVERSADADLDEAPRAFFGTLELAVES